MAVCLSLEEVWLQTVSEHGCNGLILVATYLGHYLRVSTSAHLQQTTPQAEVGRHRLSQLQLPLLGSLRHHHLPCLLHLHPSAYRLMVRYGHLSLPS